jgi:hypothetical protein
VTVSYEEIFILLQEDNVSIHLVDAYGVDIAVDAASVDISSDDVYVLVAPQETSLYLSEVGTQGPPGAPGTGGEEEMPYDLEVDDTSTPNVTYIGQADPGTAVATAAWRIKKITESGSGTSVDWADGTADFTKVWDDRLTYTYGP